RTPLRSSVQESAKYQPEELFHHASLLRCNKFERHRQSAPALSFLRSKLAKPTTSRPAPCSIRESAAPRSLLRRRLHGQYVLLAREIQLFEGTIWFAFPSEPHLPTG